ncbi:MAG: hypothetical protein ACREQ7_19935 [Candidatus Binatia bacterium]
MPRQKRWWPVILVASVVVIEVLAVRFWPPSRAKIEFAPYGDAYNEKPDFAFVEHQYPITRSALENLTPKDLEEFDEEQLNQLYARLTAGPIPDGPFDGTIIFAKGRGIKRVGELLGGLKELAVKFKAKKLEIIGETLWKGQVFYRDQRVLRNRIEDRAILNPVIQGDLSSLPKINVNGRDAWLLFPAKLYCGQSLLDGRRESIIIDYAFSDEIEGYRELPDFLAGRRGFKVRDEIRMVRPGFYLGRAYMDRFFVLTFALYNDEIAKRDTRAFLDGKIQEDCWVGTQRVAAHTK